LETEFRYEKIPRFTEESISRLGTEENGMKKNCFTNNPAPNFKSLIYFFHGTELQAFFSSAERFGTEFREFSVPRNGSDPSERNTKSLLFLFHGTEFEAFFSTAERFGTEFREFSDPRNSRNSAGTNQLFCVFPLPRNNFFVGNCQP
jgi:hypothetical protein